MNDTNMNSKSILLSTEFRRNEISLLHMSKKEENWVNVTVCEKSVSSGQCVVLKYKKIWKKVMLSAYSFLFIKPIGD